MDLADLCNSIKRGAVPATVKKVCDGVLAALKKYVISSGFVGVPMRHSKGAAIYFPTMDISPLYAGLDFVKRTGWGRFLKVLSYGSAFALTYRSDRMPIILIK